MIAKLELDNHVVSTFDVDNVQEAYDRSVEICRDFESGGLLVLDGKGYGEETYSPEDYVNLLRHASCLVGNSSSFLKEASIFGTPVVNVGSRQQGRLKPKNVLDVECNFDRIELAIHFQLVNEYEPDKIYYKENTSKLITKALKEIIHS